MMYVIIAHGPNSVQIPCMILPTKEEAEKRLSDAGIKSGVSIENEYDEKVVGEHFFTKYYGGCGGAYRYTIRTVNYGQKIVGWDLD